MLAASVDGEVTESTNKYYPTENIQAKYKLFPSKLKQRVSLLKNLAEQRTNFCSKQKHS